LKSATEGLKEKLAKTSDKDITCRIRKAYISHWIVENVKGEFICENINTWMPHYIELTSPEVVLAFPSTIVDGEKSPQLVEHENSICLQFPIKLKHPETIKILENFINHSI